MKTISPGKLSVQVLYFLKLYNLSDTNCNIQSKYWEYWYPRIYNWYFEFYLLSAWVGVVGASLLSLLMYWIIVKMWNHYILLMWLCLHAYSMAILIVEYDAGLGL